MGNRVGVQPRNKRTIDHHVPHQAKKSRCQDVTGKRPQERKSQTKVNSSGSPSENNHVKHHPVLFKHVKYPDRVSSLVRDKTQITLEDMEEDLKMYELSEPDSSKSLLDLGREPPGRRQSFIGSVLGMLFTPLRNIVGVKK